MKLTIELSEQEVQEAAEEYVKKHHGHDATSVGLFNTDGGVIHDFSLTLKTDSSGSKKKVKSKGGTQKPVTKDTQRIPE